MSVEPTGGYEESRRSRLKKFLKSEREVHFTPQDQLTMAWMGHLLILGGVTLTLWLGFHDWSWTPSLIAFYVIEGVIVVFGVLATISTRQILSAVDKTNVVSVEGPEDWMYENPTLKDRVQSSLVILLFALQFCSMATLLIATGGPIDSPFAPMALAIGVFTPFIVNKWWTVALTIVSTMVFYVLIILLVDSGGSTSSPEKGAYAMVNLFILGLASIMTLKRRDSLSFTLRKIVRASREGVWRAWTDRDQIARWLVREGEKEPDVSMELRQGGAWRVTMYDDAGNAAGVPWSGTYRELKKPERLVFTVDARSGMGEEVITVQLKKRGEHATEMIVSQADNGRFDGLIRGWSGFVDRIAWYMAIRRDTGPQGGSDS